MPTQNIQSSYSTRGKAVGPFGIKSEKVAGMSLYFALTGFLAGIGRTIYKITLPWIISFTVAISFAVIIYILFGASNFYLGGVEQVAAMLPELNEAMLSSAMLPVKAGAILFLLNLFRLHLIRINF